MYAFRWAYVYDRLVCAVAATALPSARAWPMLLEQMDENIVHDAVKLPAVNRRLSEIQPL